MASRLGGGIITPRTLKPVQGEDIRKEVPPRNQVEVYLKRLRRTVPFPIPVEEAYFGMMPDTVSKWYAQGVFSDDPPPPGKASNLLLTMHCTAELERSNQPKSRTTDPNILTISTDEVGNYLDCLRQGRGSGFERVFWMRAPVEVPVPRNSFSTPFFLPEDHPRYQEITKWYTEADAMEEDIQEGLRLVGNFAEAFPTMREMQQAWPELLNFVHFRRDLGGRPRVKIDRNGMLQLPQEYRDKTINMLTTAAMLPEKPDKLKGWVGFYSSEDV